MKRYISLHISISEICESSAELPAQRTECVMTNDGVMFPNTMWMQQKMPDEHMFIIMRLYQEYKYLQEKGAR